MSEKKTKRRLFAWISPQHRLVVMNDGSYKEESSLRLSARNALFIALSFLALWLLSAFALARLIGGSNPNQAHAYAVQQMSDADIRQQLLMIHGQLDSLESEIITRDIYIDKIQKVLNHNVETEKDIKSKRNQLAELDSSDSKPKGSREMPATNEAVNKMMRSTNIDADIASSSEPKPSPQPNTIGNSSSSADFANALVRLEQINFLPPLRGIISDTFSAARAHYGIDIVAPKGTPIKSTQAGTVVIATWSADTGHLIAVQHPNNVLSFYKHNSALLKKMGDKVQAGEAIAIIGNTGEQTEGPHLHFEIWYHGQPVNPAKYVQL